MDRTDDEGVFYSPIMVKLNNFFLTPARFADLLGIAFDFLSSSGSFQGHQE